MESYKNTHPHSFHLSHKTLLVCSSCAESKHPAPDRPLYSQAPPRPSSTAPCHRAPDSLHHRPVRLRQRRTNEEGEHHARGAHHVAEESTSCGMSVDLSVSVSVRSVFQCSTYTRHIYWLHWKYSAPSQKVASWKVPSKT